MLGLFQTIGNGLENAFLAMEGIGVKGACAVKNAAVDLRVKGTSKSKSSDADSDGIVRLKARDHMPCRDMIENSTNDVDPEEQAEAIQKFVEALSISEDSITDAKIKASEQFAQVREMLQNATPEQLNELHGSLHVLDELGSLFLTMRTEIAAAIGGKTPIMQPATPLQSQASAGGQIEGVQIARQFVTPQGINNPIPGQA